MAKKKKDMINRNQKRAVIYIRYSSTNQSDGYSIEYQLEQARKYAERNGYTIIGEYIDEAKTGKFSAGRDELFRMVDDASKNLFDIIVVFSFNRAFRNTRDALNVHFDLMEKYGIPVHSVIEPIDMSTPHGKFSATNLFAMHELSSDITAAHVKAAMYYAIQQGYYMGGVVPIGYTLTGTGEYTKGRERKRYAICPKYAPIVQEIFSLYNAGVGTTTIAQILFEKGVRSANGKVISDSSIRRILANSSYTGTSTHYFDGYEPITTDALFPSIITKETFEESKRQKEKRKRRSMPRYTGKEYYYYFTGKSYCGKCGMRTRGSSANERKDRYYFCASHQNIGVKHCNLPTMRTDTIDALIMNAINEHILNKDATDKIAKEIHKIAVKENAIKTDISALEKRQEELRKTLKKLANSYLENVISKDILEDLSEGKKEELESIEQQLLSINSQAKPVTEKDIKVFLNTIKKKKTGDIHAKKAIFDTFVDKVIMHPTHLSVDLIVPPISYKGTSGRANVPLYNIPIILEL